MKDARCRYSLTEIVLKTVKTRKEQIMETLKFKNSNNYMLKVQNESFDFAYN